MLRIVEGVVFSTWKGDDIGEGPTDFVHTRGNDRQRCEFEATA